MRHSLAFFPRIRSLVFFNWLSFLLLVMLADSISFRSYSGIFPISKMLKNLLTSTLADICLTAVLVSTCVSWFGPGFPNKLVVRVTSAMHPECPRESWSCWVAPPGPGLNEDPGSLGWMIALPKVFGFFGDNAVPSYSLLASLFKSMSVILLRSW